MQAQADAVPKLDIQRSGPSERTTRYGRIRYVHALPVAVEYGDLVLTITPAAVGTERGLVLVDVGPEAIADALAVHLSNLGRGLPSEKRTSDDKGSSSSPVRE
ncbi:hypothetical protein [Natrinema caseinilyticum]|uniref:hypothetical protein n=1 Tax=Natrinema caseinilyticum TaxID=2961570 RepID=UPI0030F49205